MDVQSRLAHQIELDAASTGRYSFNGPKSGPPTEKFAIQYVQAHLSGIDLSPRRWRHCISPRQGPDEPGQPVTVNGTEKLGHWGGITVYNRPGECRSKSVRVATLQE